MKPLSTLLGVVTGAMVITLGSTALAADLSFRGPFSQDSDVHLFDFSVETESTVTFRTYSYAGGTQADGSTVAAGGFDPMLTLFNSAGNRLFINDDDKSGTVAEDPTTGKAYDSFLTVLLAAGNYTVSLTQYGNFTNSINLADGFNQTGNFTSNFSRCTGVAAFCDFTGDSRTNRWAFDAFGVEPLREPDAEPPVTEPPVTEPPVTEPPVTEPPVPPVTEPPVTEPDEAAQVPEPATAVAFAVVGLGFLAKRRRHQ
ncbi:MAG: DVUA0089 family protein [Cyanobacteria bacterium J06656_5]